MIDRKKEDQRSEDILFKIVSLVCMFPYLLKTILTGRRILRIFYKLCGAGWGSGLFSGIADLALSVSTMLSCGACVVMLLLFAMRWTEENVEHLYLGVVCAEALRIIVATIHLIWNAVRKVTVPFPYLSVRLLLSPWLLAVLLAFAVACGLFLSLVLFDRKPFIGKTRDERMQMLQELPARLRKEVGASLGIIWGREEEQNDRNDRNSLKNMKNKEKSG